MNVSTDTCSGAYITVQIRDLMAWSANGQVIKNTFDLSGDFYIRVYNDDGSFDTSRQLTIVETVTGTCGSPQQSATGGSLKKVNSSLLTSPVTTSLAPGRKTLIFTNTARLMGPNGLPLTDSSNASLLANFRSTVNKFATHPAVGGLVVDLAADAGLAQDYAQWDTPPFPSCPAAANIVSSAIHDLINAYRVQSGSAFQYVTILGGHTVVPYHLTTDTAELEPEDGYNPGLLDQSKSAASLADSFVMTDSYYVSFTPINHVESQISLPDANMAVGRLVEFPADIMAVLQAFIDNNGVARPTSGLVTGYTFTKDLADFEAGQLGSAGVTTDSLISDTWTAPDLRAKLFGSATPGIVSINWHARSNEAVAADYATNHPTTITSSEITDLPAADTRFRNALIISIGCHLAYPLLDQDVIPNPTSPPQFVTDARAFTESFASRGAMVLGNSGYGYGDTDFVGYGEELLALVTQEITDGAPGNVPVGIALTNAKRKYVQNSGATTGVDKKSLEELTFYGPPMWSIGLPGRVAQPDSTPLRVSPVVADSAHSLFAGTVTPPYTLTQKQLPSTGTQYFEADHPAGAQAGGTQQVPYQPILPFKAFDVTSQGVGSARGVALISADYTDAPNSTASVDVPVTEVTGSRPPWPSPGFWPFQTFGLNKLVGQQLVTTPIQWKSDDGISGTTRKYNDGATTLRVYYSSVGTGAAAAGPASIGGPDLSLNGAFLHVDLPVSGSTAADVFDVLVNYTVPPARGGTGHWKTCSLMPNRAEGPTTTVSCAGVQPPLSTTSAPGGFARHYSGDIDPRSFDSAAKDLKLAFQVVTNTGLVSTRNNDGQYFSFPLETASIVNPKATTSVTIGTLPNRVTYGLNATFTATLSSKRSGCSTANQSLTFNIGSQVQTATTDGGGTATAAFNVLEVPADYKMIVSFAETQTCLGSSALAPSSPSQLTVLKEPTSLTFGATPYVAILKDANNAPMRERWVYFNFTGTSERGAAVNATRAAQTNANGIAQLHGMTVPAGTYTVKATFPGTVPTRTGTVQLSDPFYLSSSTTSTQATADRTAPSCTLTAVNYNASGVATSVNVTVQDRGSGLASVNPTQLTNGTFRLSDPDYVAGLTAPLVVTILKNDLSKSTQVTLQVVDVAGNVTNCDPEIIQVGRTKELPRRVKMSLPSTESHATIYNGTPGVTRLDIKVNNKSVKVDELRPGETRTLDLSDLMGARGDQDRITVTAHGAKDGRAVVIFSDEATNAP